MPLSESVWAKRRVRKHRNDFVSHAGPYYGLGNSHFPTSQRHRWRQKEACVNHHSNVDTRSDHYGNVKHLPRLQPAERASPLSHTLPPLLFFLSFLSSAPLFNSVVLLSLEELLRQKWTYVHSHLLDTVSGISPEKTLKPSVVLWLVCFFLLLLLLLAHSQVAEIDSLSKWHDIQLAILSTAQPRLTTVLRRKVFFLTQRSLFEPACVSQERKLHFVSDKFFYF